MSGVTIYFVIGVLLMAVLIGLLVQLRDMNRAPLEPADDTCRGEIPSRELTNRIFGPEDWEFVSNEGSESLRRLFLSRRKALAIAWVRAISADVSRLMRVHRTTARRSSALKPISELRVTLGFLVFQIICQLFICAIRLSGPTRMRGFARPIGELSEWVANVITQFLPTQQPAGRDAA